ncbi:MAG TPA: beta-N-acetylhexosaminidase [Pyrinomonadaceae bacterium]|nr:beta-N-acetylhexosaminidase [Pyrinomonadaceae bacterium]
MSALVDYNTTPPPHAPLFPSILATHARNLRRALTIAFITLLAFADAHASVQAASGAPAAPIQIIPQPRRVEATDEVFRFERATRVTLADPRSEDDRFAAADFLEDLRQTAGLALEVGGRRGRLSILVGLVGNRRIEAALARARLDAPPNLDPEGYLLSVGAREIVVAGRTAAGVFYGLQTLKQLVRREGAEAYAQGVRITDWPQMRWRGVSDDISRGPVPTVDYVKRQLRTFAFFKLNMHSFYMEHAFKSSAHPLIGPEGGSLTPAEIRELVAYARRYHIELVPEQQTFGHLHKALKLEKYNELAEVPYGDMLSPQQEGTYQLIADWYKELDPLFPGKFFHIGADETFELGEGQSREAVRARGVGAVYFEHLRRVREILQPYGRRLMFWGDIALKHPELIKSIPPDMIVMNWDYTARPSFDARIRPFKEAGLEQFICPGVQSWSQIFPNTEAAVLNIFNFVRDGQRAGALGMMNTQWDDDGESLFEMTWYGIVLGAAVSWQDVGAAQRDTPTEVAEFDSKFDWAFFRREGDLLVKAVRQLGSVNSILGTGATNDLFWRPPFSSNFQEERVRPLSEKTVRMRLAVEEAEETILRERAGVRRNASMLDAMRFAARRFDHMGRRMQVIEQFSRDYWDAYLHLGERRRVTRLRRYTGAIYNSFREMAEELAELRAAYREQWLRENRPYWLDSVTARYDLAIQTWLERGKALEEALREYNETSTLPAPSAFGLGSRPEEEDQAQPPR